MLPHIIIMPLAGDFRGALSQWSRYNYTIFNSAGFVVKVNVLFCRYCIRAMVFCLHTHTHTRTHARTHALTHTRTHARTHAHTRTHTPWLGLLSAFFSHSCVWLNTGIHNYIHESAAFLCVWQLIFKVFSLKGGHYDLH